MSTKSFILLLLFLILFCTAIVIGAAFYLNKLPPFLDFLKKDSEIAEEQYNYTSFEILAKDESGNNLDNNYILKNKGVTAEGRLKSTSLEVYNKVKENITYTLYTWSDQYYLAQTECDSTTSKCQAENTKIGDIKFRVYGSNNRYTLVLDIENGSIRNPAICIGWSINILSARMDLHEIDVPREFRNHYDVCYTDPKILDKTQEYGLKVVFYSAVDKDHLEFLVMDQVEFLDNSDNLREGFSYQGEDLGAGNLRHSFDILAG